MPVLRVVAVWLSSSAKSGQLPRPTRAHELELHTGDLLSRMLPWQFNKSVIRTHPILAGAGESKRADRNPGAERYSVDEGDCTWESFRYVAPAPQ
jgi:hypothetical protein